MCGVPDAPDLDDAHYRSAIRRALIIAAVAALAVALFYVVFVRTRWGQEIDDIAFEGPIAIVRDCPVGST